MATLDNKPIRGTLPAVFKYIDAPDKNIPPNDLARVGAYIHGDHSVERLYSRGHNGCSHNPDVALQQFRACEALYRQRKGGAKESGLGKDKEPVIAEHFFLSFPVGEKVTYEMQCEIADKLMASPLLRDFYAMSNRHYNTDNDHTHILVSNISKDGTRKLGMKNAKRNELRKELDRICALDYGLSIIDAPALRHNDPEREAFVRSMVGVVDVYVPADWRRVYNPDREYDAWMLEQIDAGTVLVAEGKSKNAAGITQAEAYTRWVAGQDFYIRERDKKAAREMAQSVRIYEDQKNDRTRKLYYWREEYRKKEEKKEKTRYYWPGTSIYKPDGRRKTLLELVFDLILIALDLDSYVAVALNYDPDKTVDTFFYQSREMRVLCDMETYQTKHGIRTPRELALKIQNVGSDLKEVRVGLAYYRKVLQHDDELNIAVLVFWEMERTQFKNGVLTEQEQTVLREAWKILAAHGLTEKYQVFDFTKKREFTEKKVEELEKREKLLKQDYHELKFLESHLEGYQAEVARLLTPNNGGLSSAIERAEALARMQQTIKEWETEKERGV